MGKVATGGGEPRELIPARTYRAIIIGVYDIGTQPGFGDRGPTGKYVLEYELSTRKGPALDQKGNALTICQFVSFYLGSVDRKSDLLKVVEAVSGKGLTAEQIKKGIDVERLLDRACQVQVAHKADPGKEARARVEAVLALDPDDDAPVTESDTHYFEITPEVIRTGELPSYLPKFVADYARKSREMGGNVGGGDGDGHGKGPGKATPVMVGPPGPIITDNSDDDDIPF